MKNLKLSQIYVLVSITIFASIGLFSKSSFVSPQMSLNAALVVPNSEPILLEVADTPQKWASGLMGRISLPRDRGMFFKFGGRQVQRVWMKNTLIPLDILMIDGDKVVDLKKNLQPCSENCLAFTSQAVADSAIEFNAGLANKLDIKVGDRLKIISLKPRREIK